MKENISPLLVNIGYFSAKGIMFKADCITKLIEKLPGFWQGLLARSWIFGSEKLLIYNLIRIGPLTLIRARVRPEFFLKEITQ
jgi:hypothetical protein